ncbi:MAG: HD-GYP domain-containing protein, partial [Bacillota bacterium]|nr:HD-GYP domain-containing protein [Bacillota bacterium]
EFVMNGEETSMIEQKITLDKNNIFIYESKIEENEFKKIDGDMILIVTRLRGSWHKIYFNDILIGTIGDLKDGRMNIWNQAYKFTIDKNLINNNNNNILKFVTYSDYKIGYSTIPIMISNLYTGNLIFYKLVSLYSNLYKNIMIIIIVVALLEIILFSLSKSKKNEIYIFPIIVLLGSFYILDYIVIEHSMISSLMMKKITLVSLYFVLNITSIAFYKLYKRKIILVVSALVIITTVIGVIVSNNMITWSSFYSKINLLLILSIFTWIYTTFLEYLKTKETKVLMLFFASLFLVIPSVADTLTIIFNVKNQRISIFGILFFSIALLLLAMEQFIYDQKHMYFIYKHSEIERERLKNALITDELTGLCNHKSFYNRFDIISKENNKKFDIIYFNVDKFRSVNDLFGYEIGDKLLIKLANIILKNITDSNLLFRYSGDVFVAINDNKNRIDKFEIAEKIRQEVLNDKELQNISNYLPQTISIGISSYPKDSINPRVLINKAEKACRFAKELGRNKTIIYTEDILENVALSNKNDIRNQMFIDFTYALAGAIDMKDEYTGKHSEQVSRYSMMIAEKLDLDSDLKYALRLGGLLHDVGKLSIPDSIIQKNGKLTIEEYNVIKKHPLIGYDIVKELVDDNNIMSCIRWHHERCDGKGYPDGLKGKNIPLVSRIICVADAYHAMTSTRSYRKEFTKEVAINELINNVGTQFDKEIVDVFVKLIK